MKVVIVGSHAFDSLEYHLNDSFKTLGHEVSVLDVTDGIPVSAKINYWASRFIDTYDRLIAERVAHKITRLCPNLVLIVYRNLHPCLAELIKKQCPGAVVVQVNPDALTNLEKQQILAADFDWYFSKEPYVVDFLRDKAGLNAHYLPEGFNPRVHQKPPVEKAVAEWLTNIDVLIFGSLYAYRARMIEQLMQAGINVAVYGTEGPYLRPVVQSAFRRQYLSGPEKNRLLYGAKIVVNTLHYAEITSVNQKYFEINGVGGFQLCDYKPTIDEYSGVPAEEITYRTMNEAVDKIRYYLARPHERHVLAARQYAHFQTYHSFDQRVAELINLVSFQKRPIPSKQPYAGIGRL